MQAYLEVPDKSRRPARHPRSLAPAVRPDRYAGRPTAPKRDGQAELGAKPYPVRVTDAEYLATCVKAFGPHKNIYGNTVYLTFRIVEGQYAGQTIPMFLRFSIFPTSNFFRCWCIANEGLPSRNARLSPRMFLGKTYTIRTVTVRPRQRITGKDGIIRSGDPLPDFFAYSKVDCLVRLEINPDSAGFVTQTPCKSSSESALLTGGVSSTESEARSTTETACFEVPRGAVLAECTDRAGRTDTPAGPAPVGIPVKKHLESAVFRKRLFELYDNLPPFFEHTQRLHKLVEKAVGHLFLNRGQELQGVNEDAVLEAACQRMNGSSVLEGIHDYEKRRKVAVSCVVNTVTEAALDILKMKSDA